MEENNPKATLRAILMVATERALELGDFRTHHVLEALLDDDRSNRGSFMTMAANVIRADQVRLAIDALSMAGLGEEDS